jgi:hypothetical protein
LAGDGVALAFGSRADEKNDVLVGIQLQRLPAEGAVARAE